MLTLKKESLIHYRFRDDADMELTVKVCSNIVTYINFRMSDDCHYLHTCIFIYLYMNIYNLLYSKYGALGIMESYQLVKNLRYNCAF